MRASGENDFLEIREQALIEQSDKRMLIVKKVN